MCIRELCRKYKDVILYLFFGVCTTSVNVVVYWGMTHILNMPVMLGTILAWFFAVLFAYCTNRKWVFHSEAKGIQAIKREMTSFFGCRIITGMFDWASMLVFVDILAWNDVLIKFLANVVVIVLNYIASKLLVFKKQGGSL